MSTLPYTTAVILAAGSGTRMGASVTKQKMLLCGQSVLYHSVRAFALCPKIQSIVIVTRADEVEFARSESLAFPKVSAICVGGETRGASAAIGVNAAPPQTEYVCLHDAARCLVTPDLIETVVACAHQNQAATAVGRINDTVKWVGEDQTIEKTIPRERLRVAQTPQVFSAALYREALLQNDEQADRITDDNQLFERMGVPVMTVENPSVNIKITTPADLEFAEYIMKARGK